MSVNSFSGMAAVPTSYGFTAAKNKFINGDFSVNQRAFTSVTSDSTYTFDRWRTQIATTAGTATFTPQTFTPGAAPVAGYEGANFAQCITSGVTGSGTITQVCYAQRIEDVRTFANQTVTFSLWAKAGSGTPNLGVRYLQNFGTGGSALVTGIIGAVTAISTSWTRYSFTVAVPSISGKTIGTSSYLDLRIYFAAGSGIADVSGVGLQDNTFQIWGAQIESGSTASAFQTATGTIQGELAAAQRYYYNHVSGTDLAVGSASNYSATILFAMISFPVTMRTAPTLSATSGTGYYSYAANAAVDAFNSFTADRPAKSGASVYNSTEIAGTIGQGGYVFTSNASAFISFSAEL